MAEIHRRRLKLAAWFKSEKLKASVHTLEEVELARKAAERPELEALLQERDERVIKEIMRLANIEGRRKQAAVTRLAKALREQEHYTDVENFVFANNFNSCLSKQTLLKTAEVKKIRTAFSDWLQAIRIFGTPAKRIS